MKNAHYLGCDSSVLVLSLSLSLSAFLSHAKMNIEFLQAWGERERVHNIIKVLDDSVKFECGHAKIKVSLTKNMYLCPVCCFHLT